MNTFLPNKDYRTSANVLDDKRLNKQRLEVRQILDTLTGDSQAWANHPCTLMWRGSEWQLTRYGLAICAEWVSRGYRDNIASDLRLAAIMIPEGPEPWWLGDERLHSSHRSNLLRKNPTYYGMFGWTEMPQEPYWWPMNKISSS